MTFRLKRLHLQMVLIHPVINRANGTLDISVPSASGDAAPRQFSVPLAHPSTYLNNPESDPSLDHDYAVWGCDPQDGYTVGSPELLAALSQFMERDVLLIRKGHTRRSVAEVPGVVHSEGFQPVVGFADFYSMLIASATSLKSVAPPPGTVSPIADVSRPVRELSSRIPALASDPEFDASRWSPPAIAERGGLEINRFRANIVVEGVPEPWEEDGWKQLTIGNEPIEVGLRCARCMVGPVQLLSVPCPCRLTARFAAPLRRPRDSQARQAPP